jgi:hypothetical protein
MPKYYVKHTDINKPEIEVDEGSINDTSLDITLFGRTMLEYGEKLNQNLLNLLENFAAPMDLTIVEPSPTPMPSFSATPTPSIAPTPTPTPTPSAGGL